MSHETHLPEDYPLADLRRFPTRAYTNHEIQTVCADSFVRQNIPEMNEPEDGVDPVSPDLPLEFPEHLPFRFSPQNGSS